MTAPVQFVGGPYAAALPPEHQVLLQLEPDPAPRLNLILPHCFANHAFGGVLSALEIGKALSRHYPSFRLVSEHALAVGERLFDPRDWCAPGVASDSAVHNLTHEPLSCHQREVFCCTWWTTTLAWEAYAAALAHTGREAPQWYYIIQDFEPGFYQFGSNYMASLASHRHGERCFAIFNSPQLHSYFEENGLRYPRHAVLTPSLNPVLRQVLEDLGWRLRKTSSPLVICLYGRPEQPRNCFAATVEGLRRYLLTLSPEDRAGLVLVSLGKPHEPLELAPGATLASLGRLPLEKYAAFLAGAHVGLAMMATPHPSYPPLEMAAFGLETLTNDFPGKALAGVHPQLHTIAQPSPRLIAEALPTLVTAAKHMAGSLQPVTLPECLSKQPWEENIRDAALPRLEC